jgi:hypothetical protein
LTQLYLMGSNALHWATGRKDREERLREVSQNDPRSQPGSALKAIPIASGAFHYVGYPIRSAYGFAN